MRATLETRPAPHVRGALAALYAGLALSIVATAAPYVDLVTGHVLADHVRHGYPAYSDGRIDSAVTTWLVILSVVGVLAIAAWVWTIRAVRAGRRWAPAAATATFLVGTGVALYALLVKDTSGETGLAPLLGWIGVLPCLPGLVGVAMLWRSAWSRQPEWRGAR
jgi:MFS family permease